MNNEINNTSNEASLDFIRSKVKEDLLNNKNNGKVVTRFPPEPNGYLHIGHAKSIVLNFSVALENNGVCHLRFDDTNPTKEDVEFVDSIQNDVKWLGFDWNDKLFYASDYFDKFYNYAVDLIKKGKAYVCSLTPDELKEYRGTPTEPGKNSPYRDRSVEENLDLFEKMRNGEFEEGLHILRAKIDMASPNIIMRDPAIYRVKKMHHHKTGDKWCIYPMYDFAHCLSDSIEGITHSLCTLEFEIHRPLYDWFLDELEVECHPQQIEFARLNLSYTVMSKRKLQYLVENKFVSGWDDPRMPTIAGLKRRGYTPNSIRDFSERVGIAKRDNTVELELLEYCIRQDLEKTTPRVMGVLKPIKVIIENYPEGQVEEIDAPYHPDMPEMETRKVPFTRELYIESDDFMENPPKKFFRLAPGREVRLRYAYFIKCHDIVKDENTGEIKEVRCTYDPETKGGHAPDGRKVKVTMHWVSAEKAIKSEVRLYNNLFNREFPEEDSDGLKFTDRINENSLEVVNAYLEPSMSKAKIGERFQFERLGYFIVDTKDPKDNALVFNRTVTLKDAWAKIKSSEAN